MTDCDCSLAKEWARLRRGEIQSRYGVWSCIAIFEYVVIDFASQYKFSKLRARAETAIEDHVCVCFVSDAPSCGVSVNDRARILEIESTIPKTISRRFRISKEEWERASDLLGRTVTDSRDMRISEHDYDLLINTQILTEPCDTVLVGGLIWKKRLATAATAT